MQLLTYSESIHAIRPRATLTRKRGRPKNDCAGRDTGTPELVMKRLLGQTIEILDLYLKKSIITPNQHWCGIHFRWLYTLRFGVPSIRSVDTTDVGGLEIKPEDHAWSQAREVEYKEAIHCLTKAGRLREVVSVCIHNEYPHNSRAINQSLAVSEGLDLLRRLWICDNPIQN